MCFFEETLQPLFFLVFNNLVYNSLLPVTLFYTVWGWINTISIHFKVDCNWIIHTFIWKAPVDLCCFSNKYMHCYSQPVSHLSYQAIPLQLNCDQYVTLKLQSAPYTLKLNFKTTYCSLHKNVKLTYSIWKMM